ncbi:uncharacterized protein LOC120539113 isoform X2 [Polypterus senegalus]|uniref:uncharacterized protein LOC120539113 isoform X2 n=1 Tax=Polypterus senegalus TaxID=55291 RepID=UPI00196278C4|nr:uncharacterized protein LOC120539113 isoform X2 [Polypterus senegalus]
MKASLLVLLMIAYSTWSCCNGDNNNHDVSGGNCVKNNGKGHCCNGDNSAKANSRDNCDTNGNNFELLSSSGNNYIRSIFSVDNGDSSQTGFSPLFSCVVAQLHFVSNNLTWANAQNYCRTNYTDLVTIKKKMKLSHF